MTHMGHGDARDPHSPHPSQEVDVMSDGMAVSIGRISMLLNYALDCLDSDSDPRSGDPWWRLSASTLPAQFLVLQASVPRASVATLEHADSVTYQTAEQCLRQVQDELASWDWDALDGEVLVAGVQFVLDIADLVSQL